MILSNKIECKKCHSIIESLHRHDYKSCKCGRVAVDGGREYLRRSFKKDSDFIELSVVLYEPNVSKSTSKRLLALNQSSQQKERKKHAKRT